MFLVRYCSQGFSLKNEHSSRTMTNNKRRFLDEEQTAFFTDNEQCLRTILFFDPWPSASLEAICFTIFFSLSFFKFFIPNTKIKVFLMFSIFSLMFVSSLSLGFPSVKTKITLLLLSCLIFVMSANIVPFF